MEREARHGPNHVTTRGATRGLAAAERRLGNYSASIKILEELVKTQAAELPEDTLDFIYVLVELAEAYRAEKRFRLAQVAYEVALVKCAKLLGPYHQDTLIVLEGLAV